MASTNQSRSQASSRKVSEAMGAVSQVADTAAREAASTATRLAKKATRTAEDNIMQVADTVQAEANGFGSAIARATQAGANELQESGYGTAAAYVNRLGDGAADIADSIDEYDVQRAVGRVTQSISQRPLFAFGALAVLGFAGAMAAQRYSQPRNR